MTFPIDRFFTRRFFSFLFGQARHIWKEASPMPLLPLPLYAVEIRPSDKRRRRMGERISPSLPPLPFPRFRSFLRSGKEEVTKRIPHPHDLSPRTTKRTRASDNTGDSGGRGREKLSKPPFPLLSAFPRSSITFPFPLPYFSPTSAQEVSGRRKKTGKRRRARNFHPSHFGFREKPPPPTHHLSHSFLPQMQSFLLLFCLP